MSRTIPTPRRNGTPLSVGQRRMPEEVVRVETADDGEYVIDTLLARTIIRGHESWLWRERYAEELEHAVRKVTAMAKKWLPSGKGWVRFQAGNVVCEVKVDERLFIEPRNAIRLHEILGTRFKDLVFEERTFTPTIKLTAMAERDEAIGRLITRVHASPAVTFESRRR